MFRIRKKHFVFKNERQQVNSIFFSFALSCNTWNQEICTDSNSQLWLHCPRNFNAHSNVCLPYLHATLGALKESQHVNKESHNFDFPKAYHSLWFVCLLPYWVYICAFAQLLILSKACFIRVYISYWEAALSFLGYLIKQRNRGY